jgi:hypothetical protein
VLDFIEPEEVYFLHSIWNFVGPCSLQAGISSRSNQDCSNYVFGTTYINHTTKGNSGSHMILQEVYQRLCADHNTNGKVVKEGSKVLME